MGFLNSFKLQEFCLNQVQQRFLWQSYSKSTRDAEEELLPYVKAEILISVDSDLLSKKSTPKNLQDSVLRHSFQHQQCMSLGYFMFESKLCYLLVDNYWFIYKQ